MLLNVSTLNRPELHLDVFRLQEPVLLLDVPTKQGLELHLELSGQQESSWSGQVHTIWA